MVMRGGGFALFSRLLSCKLTANGPIVIKNITVRMIRLMSLTSPKRYFSVLGVFLLLIVLLIFILIYLVRYEIKSADYSKYIVPLSDIMSRSEKYVEFRNKSRANGIVDMVEYRQPVSALDNHFEYILYDPTDEINLPKELRSNQWKNSITKFHHQFANDQCNLIIRRIDFDMFYLSGHC